MFGAALLFGDEQDALPGIPAAARPALRLVIGDDDPAAPPHCPGQLSLAAHQLDFSEYEPEPCQPSLIHDAPFWELPTQPVPSPAPRRATRAQRGAPVRRRRTLAGQLRLFA